MVRKVGFGAPNTRDKRSIADQYVDRFRKKSRRTKPKSDAEKSPPALVRRLGIILFLVIWLFFWSAAIIMVAATLINGDSGAGLFLIVWETLAILGWVAAVVALRRQIRGKSSQATKSK